MTRYSFKVSALILFSLLLKIFQSYPQPRPILVQPEIQFQRMDGFGATSGNGCAQEIYALPQAERTKILDLLFGPDGARMNILRNEIWWTGKRLPFTHPLYLRGFVYYFADEENETSQYFLMREAQARNEMIVNSCVWTPPPQWKTNNSPQDGGELLPTHYEDFADYLLGYLQFYKRLRNQDIQILSLQNEPNKKQAGQSCLWSGEQLRDFVKIVGKRFKQKGVSTKIMLPETEWEQVSSYLQPILKDAEARPLLSYVSAHSHGASESSSGMEKAAMKDISKKLTLKLWQSEFAIAQGVHSQDIPDGLQLAGQMLHDLIESDCHAWVYWAFLAPAGWSGRQGLLARQGNSVSPTKRFWCFTQFSRFIPRDAVRISALGGIVPVIAFRNPEYNGLILVLVNPTADAVTENVELRGWTMERTVAYRTSDKEDCSQVSLPPESGSKRSLSLTPQSVTTIIAQIRRVRGG
jgi:O-glycosyl hydrolase